MKKSIKIFAALAMVAMAPALVSCEPEGGSGTSEITIPGIEGDWDEAFLSENYNGELSIKGLYSTSFQFHIFSSGQDGSMLINFTAFHDSASFAPGTYTFPSTGAGTALGDIAIFTGGPGVADLSGQAVSGSVNVAVSGKTYTVTFNNVSMYTYKVNDDGSRTDEETKQISFKYTGQADYKDASPWEYKRNPEYGKSTIVETTTGLKDEYMQLVLSEIDNTGYMIQLSSRNLTNTGGILVSANLSSGGGSLKPGTYIFGESGEGTFSGWLNVDDLGANIYEGEITIAETGGLYTITLTGVAGEEYNLPEGAQARHFEFNGTYTGGRVNID